MKVFSASKFLFCLRICSSSFIIKSKDNCSLIIKINKNWVNALQRNKVPRNRTILKQMTQMVKNQKKLRKKFLLNIFDIIVISYWQTLFVRSCIINSPVLEYLFSFSWRQRYEASGFTEHNWDYQNCDSDFPSPASKGWKV